MFHSFDEELFYKAIKDKDFIRLKTNTVSAIRNDPTFSGKKDGEIGNVLRLLHDRIPEIFEEEKDLGYEEHLDESQWDSRYFTRLTFWFQENFAEKRLDEIERVGKKVYAGETEKTGDVERHIPKSSEANKSKTMINIAIAGAITAGIAALALLILKLTK